MTYFAGFRARMSIVKAVIVLILSLPLIFFSSIGFAHTSLISSEPRVDAILEQFPERVLLEFNEPLLLIGDLSANRFTLQAPDGEEIALGEFTVEGSRISAAPQHSQHEGGQYRVNYRVVASDGHVIKGEVSFTVKGPTKDASESEGTLEQSPSGQRQDTGTLILFLVLALALCAMIAIYRRSGSKDAR